MLLVKAFVVDVYLVDSASMEPAIHGAAEGGERVLVRYERRPALRRFDLVVLRLPGEPDPVVKRVVGLPGESVLISNGDVLIDRRRLDPSAPRPAPVLMFDSARQPLQDCFHFAGPWRLEGGERALDVRDLAPDGDAALLCYQRPVDDGWLAPDGTLIEGRRPVGDLVLESEVTVEGAGGRLFWRLTEQGDLFEFELWPGPDGQALARILRRQRGAPPEPLAEGRVPFAGGARHSVLVANVDDSLVLRIDGSEGVLSASYEANRPLSGPSRHLLPRACLGAAGLAVRVGRVRLSRDLAYTQRGTFGVLGEVTLGPDELFVLGDNSSDSVDGRDWGPVGLSDVLGVPSAVVWPLARARWLRGAEWVLVPAASTRKP